MTDPKGPIGPTATAALSDREQWMQAAMARHAHIPDAVDRAVRIQRTFEDIQYEASLVAIRLPLLSSEEQKALLDEACLEVLDRLGVPFRPAQEALLEAAVDDLFQRLCLRAREQKAPFVVRAKLVARRLLRAPGCRSYIGLGRDL